ncbi:NAD-binding protein [Desulfovibrio cuneatus]|uniref:NAD-binding protein n=1 Tax=Desulfovibrio cuneatus TaxID=159728 RepID=UPI0003FD7871|nr:NAD-binding protein [Desulfovibrio cuneatus]
MEETETVVVTTHDDDVNIYLTMYCRKLRTGVQIISRANLDRNVVNLYSAGANLVVSQAGMVATTIVNLLTPNRVFMLTEGMSVFRVLLPASLRGKNLVSMNIRTNTECNVVAIARPDGVQVPPDPQAQLNMGDELVLIGSR